MIRELQFHLLGNLIRSKPRNDQNPSTKSILGVVRGHAGQQVARAARPNGYWNSGSGWRFVARMADWWPQGDGSPVVTIKSFVARTWEASFETRKCPDSHK